VRYAFGLSALAGREKCKGFSQHGSKWDGGWRDISAVVTGRLNSLDDGVKHLLELVERGFIDV